MLVTVSTSVSPATDLGHLLHKHPDRVRAFPQSSGTATVFFPEATAERCTAALLLEVDPIALGRSGGPKDVFALGQYVNDRPYAATSMLATALRHVFRTAFAGRCDARPELAASAIPLEVHVPAVSCRDGAGLVQRLFAPMGWSVRVGSAPLDPAVPEWGDSPYLDVRLTGTIRLADALHHLAVLLPVLDDAKHYWVGDDEVEALVRAGGGWLGAHPERALIAARSLAHQRTLTQSALGRLSALEARPEQEAREEAEVPARPLADQRRAAVLAAVRAAAPHSVGDLGCGEGALLAPLLDEPGVLRVVATDVSVRALRTAARRLRLDDMPEPRRGRLQLFQSSLLYRDERLADLDVAVLMEVVEHVDPPRLPALERALFGEAAPRRVIVTTPNAEHNVRYPSLESGVHRHPDHRFEWTRAEFAAWSAAVGERYGYTTRMEPVGPVDAEVGAPTQLCVFMRGAA